MGFSANMIPIKVGVTGIHLT